MTTHFTSDDLELLTQVSQWEGPQRLKELDDELLRQISKTKGVDFATALLYHGIRASTDNGSFLRRVDELLQDSQESRASGAGLDAALVIAPGAFYREHPETGADGKSLCAAAESLGCRPFIIPTESVGGAAVNGKLICNWLMSTSEENIILCSLSKGGADMKMALAERDAPRAFRNVLAWLNIGGITNGSPMASWLLERPWLSLLYRALFWWRGQDFRFICDLDRRPGSLLDFPISVPPHVKVIHVVGFPLARHIRARPSGSWHRRLSHHGPNDGATILADSCGQPGLIYPVWGADHYLNTKLRPDELIRALLKYLGEDLELFRKSPRSNSLAKNSA